MEFLNHMTQLFLNFWEIFILVNLNSYPLDYFVTSQFQGLEKASDQELWVKFWDSGGSPKPRKICHLCYSALLLRFLAIDLKGMAKALPGGQLLNCSLDILPDVLQSSFCERVKSVIIYSLFISSMCRNKEESC